jgi:hypothetical protein
MPSDGDNDRRHPLPLHLVSHDRDGGALVVKRRPGRPRKVVAAPTGDQEAYLIAVNRLRDEHVARDAVVRVLNEGQSPKDVLKEIKQALAIEGASIGWELRRSKATGAPSEQLSSRRIDAMHKIALVELASYKLGVVELDARSSAVQLVLGLFLQVVEAVAREALPDSDAFLARYRQALQGWEDLLDHPARHAPPQSDTTSRDAGPKAGGNGSDGGGGVGAGT